MASLKQKIKRLHRKNSRTHAVLLSVVLVSVLGLSAIARFYVIVPLRMMDSSMAPNFKERSVVWMCKLPFCLEKVSEDDIVWATLRGNEDMVRKVLAMPGDTLSISDRGQVQTPRHKFRWKNEEAFIQGRSFYIPKAGDTLDFEKLNDIEQDYIISYLREKGEHVVVKTTLWQGDREINIDRVGSTKIANRQVSLNEIDYLPWQDRFLIEMQIRQSEPGNQPVTLKRKIFRGIKKFIPPSPAIQPPDSSSLTAIDSTESIQDSTAMTVDSIHLASDSVQTDNKKMGTEAPVVEEVITEPIHQIVVTDDCYYLTCTKGNSCPDSREIGYVTKNKLIGRYLEWPTRIDRAVVTPTIHYIKAAYRMTADICSDIYTQVMSWFESKPEEESSQKNNEAKKADK